MQVIDRREDQFSTTFGDLAIGEAFQDEGGDINIKTNVDSSIYWAGGYWALGCAHTDDEFVIPLEVTYTFESEGGRK